jgi:NAD(P)-dependent dehydrogenase (short-subunit alcohol dehydrogenase family)
MKFDNSTFIVTGGASGLGEATVRSFHGAGARVVIADLNVECGEKLAAELGARAAFQRTDVSAEADAQACVDRAVSAFGGLQGLINCAGIGIAEKVLNKDGPQKLPNFARVININLVGSFNMAWDGQIGQAAYAASKAGIVGMTLPIARELARFGIRVCTIAPGLFYTPMMESLPPEIQESLGKSVPFPPRLGRPDEFAKLAMHIVENEMLNGESIRLDGAVRLAPK